MRSKNLLRRYRWAAGGLRCIEADHKTPQLHPVGRIDYAITLAGSWRDIGLHENRPRRHWIQSHNVATQLHPIGGIDLPIAMRDPKALPSFLIAITTHVLRHELRRRWVRRCMTLGTKEDIGIDPRVVHPNHEARQAVSRLYGILDRLGSEERLAFVLRFVEGMALNEVAGALGLSLATTKRRLLHARARFDHHVAKDPGLASYLSGIDEDSP